MINIPYAMRTFLLFLAGVLFCWMFAPPAAHAGVILQHPLYLGLNSGLVGWWTFDGHDMTLTTAKDLSGQSNNGTLTNGPVRAIGKLGQGLSFDGVNDYVDGTSNTTLQDLSQFTYTAWIYPRRVTNVDELFVAGKDSLNSDGTAIGVGDFFNGANSRRLYGFVDFDTTDAQSESVNGTMTANEWQFIAMTWAGGTNVIRLYRGTAAASVAEVSYGLQQAPVGARISDADESLTIGARLSSGAVQIPFDGKIDDVRVYNRVLSMDEIKRLYKIGATFKINTTISNDSLRTGLVGHWSFDGPDLSVTTAVDKSGQGNNGTLTNGPKPAIGKLGQGMEFDGVDDLVDLGTPFSLGNMTVRTMSAWIKPRTLGEGNYGAIFMHATGGIGHVWWQLCSNTVDCSNVNTFIFRQPRLTTSGLWQAPADTIKLNTWQHVVVVHDQSSNSNDPAFYYNGVRIAETEVTTPAGGAVADDSGDIKTIGNTSDAGSTFDGLIDDVRIYNRALSADEIKRLYKIGGTLKVNTTISNDSLRTGLVGHWTFDGNDMTGNTARDLSGNSNTGTLTNGPKPAIGKLGQALEFDGVDDDVTINGTLGSPVNITVSAWGLLTRVEGVSSSEDLVDINDQVVIRMSDTEVWGFYYDGVTWNSTLYTAAYPGTGWHHFVYVVDDTNNVQKLYVDGGEVATTNFTTSIVYTAGSTLIGKHIDSGDSWTGSIDDVRIYNRALSRDEIKRLYNLGR